MTGLVFFLVGVAVGITVLAAFADACSGPAQYREFRNHDPEN